MDALEGLKVVDLSPTEVGAQASQLLGDFGADVVWVERPGGSTLRSRAAFPFLCRGKRSVVVDFDDAGSLEQLRAVIDGADVVIETFRPGVADRRGLGYQELSARNPRLVYASISGWGPSDRYADAPGYEALVQAKLGVFQVFRGLHPAGRPSYVSVPWCSFPASQLAVQGVLAALVERERSGAGQRVETSLVQGFAALDTWSWFVHLLNQRYPGAYPSADAYDDDGIPAQAFPFMLLVALTRDGRWLQFAQVAPHLFVALMKALGLEGMLTDPAWAGIPNLDTAERRQELWTTMLEAAGRRTLAEWEAVFEADPDVFAEAFREGTDVLRHPQLAAGGDVVEVVDPAAGPVRQPGPLVHLGATPARVDRPAPSLGSSELGQLGWAGRLESGGGGGGAPGDGRDGEPPRELPLAGVTILELAVLYAAPFGATLLTDLGARVVKVEPLAGDPVRQLIPFPEAAGVKVMQGKESICIDLATPEGLAIVHRLAERADLVLQGFRAGVADRLGVGAADLHKVNPELMYLHASGYGPHPPDGHRPSFAPSIGAAAGVARTNLGDTVPERPGLTLDEIRLGSRLLAGASTQMTAQADGIAAVGVASSLLLAALAQARGAGGQAMVSSMLATATHALAGEVVDFEGAVHPAKPDPDVRGTSARYRIYDASDGYVFLAAPQEHEWPRLVAALAPWVDLADARFAAETDRLGHDDELAAVLAATFLTRSKDDWERDLLATGVGCVAVTTAPIESVLQGDDFGTAHGFVVEVDHPTFGRHPRLAPLMRFSRSATQAKAGQLAGDATDALLGELGYRPDEIEDLRSRQIVA